VSFEFVIDIGATRKKVNTSLRFTSRNPGVIFISGSDGEYTTIDIDDVAEVAEALIAMMNVGRSCDVSKYLRA